MDLIIFSIIKTAYYSFQSLYFFYYQFLYLSIILGINLILWKFSNKNKDFDNGLQIFFSILFLIAICIYIWNNTNGFFTLFQIFFIIFLSLKILEHDFFIRLIIFLFSFTITIIGSSIILINTIIEKNKPPEPYCKNTQIYVYTHNTRIPDGEHIVCYNEKNEIISDEIYD